MAEVIKYGAIRDEELFNHLMGDIDIGWVIQRCVNIKKTVVQNDEFDTGERMILNFGHTFGHVVEKLTGYTEYTHGEAVAMGMLRITQKSEAMGITKEGTSARLKELLSKYNLVFDEYTFDSDLARDVLTLDKKSTKDYINYIMIKDIGEVIINKLPKEDTFLTD